MIHSTAFALAARSTFDPTHVRGAVAPFALARAQSAMEAEARETELVSLSHGDEEEFQVPRELLEGVSRAEVGSNWSQVVNFAQEEVFQSVLSVETWRNVLGEEERERLTQLLPPGPPSQQQEDLMLVETTDMRAISYLLVCAGGF